MCYVLDLVRTQFGLAQSRVWKAPCDCTDGLGALGDHQWSVIFNLHPSVSGSVPTTHRHFHWKMSGKWQETRSMGDSPLSHRLLGRHSVLTKSCLSAGLCFHLQPHFYRLCVSGLRSILFEHGKLHPVLAHITLCLPPASMLPSLKWCKKLSVLP